MEIHYLSTIFLITRKRAFKFYSFFFIRVSLDLPNNFQKPVATLQISTFGPMKLKLFSRMIHKFTSNRTLLNIRFRKPKNFFVDIIQKNSWNQKSEKLKKVREYGTTQQPIVDAVGEFPQLSSFYAHINDVKFKA